MISKKTEYPGYELFAVDVNDNDASRLVAAAHIDLVTAKLQPYVTATWNKVMVTFHGEYPCEEMIEILHTFTREDGIELATNQPGAGGPSNSY